MEGFLLHGGGVRAKGNGVKSEGREVIVEDVLPYHA